MNMYLFGFGVWLLWCALMWIISDPETAHIKGWRAWIRNAIAKAKGKR